MQKNDDTIPQNLSEFYIQNFIKIFYLNAFLFHITKFQKK